MNIVPRYVPIEGPGNERLLRDTQSMGIINTNNNAYLAAKHRATAANLKLAEDLKDKATLMALQKDMLSIQSELQAIKDSLTMLINRLS